MTHHSRVSTEAELALELKAARARIAELEAELRQLRAARAAEGRSEQPLQAVSAQSLSTPAQDGPRSGELPGKPAGLTELERTEEERALVARLLEVAGGEGLRPLVLSRLAEEIRRHTGCEAVGIRLLDAEGNIPYEGHVGFPDAFYRAESPLNIKSDRCMCISVIKGDVDATLPYITRAGSFYLNGTTRFLATLSEADKGETRNACNAAGYESVALVPFRWRGRILGLIHLADRRENKVPLELVELIERLAGHLGAAFGHLIAEQQLQDSARYYRSLIHSLHEDLIVIDRDYRISDINNMALRTAGYARDDVLGRHCYEISHGLNKPCHEHGEPCGLRRVIATGEPCSLHHEHTRSDGRRVHVDLLMSPLKDDRGKVTRVIESVRDVTDLYNAQEELRRSEASLCKAQEIARLGSWEMDLKSGELRWSDGMYRIHGLARESTPSTGAIRDLILAEDVPALDAALGAITAGEADRIAESVEYRIRRGDGEIRWINARVDTQRDSSGAVTTVRGTVQDITEVKQAEAALRQSEAQLAVSNRIMAAILGHTHVMAAYLDPRFSFVWVNRTYADAGEQEPSAYLGKSYFDLYPHADNQGLFQQVVATGEPCFVAAKPFEDPERPERGVTYWDQSLVPVKAEGGEVSGLVLTLVDVTARVRAQAALRVSDERHRALFEHMPSGVAVYEPLDDGADFRFVGFNRAAETIDGISRSQVVGQRLRTAFPGVGETGLLEALRRVWRTGKSEKLPDFHYRDGQREGWRENRVYRLPNGNVVAIYDNVTDLYKAQRELRRSEASLARAQEIARLGSWEWDLGTGALSWSSEMCSIYGLAAGSAPRSDAVRDLILAEDVPVFDAAMQAIETGEVPASIMYRIRRAEGEIRWIHSRADAQRDPSGAITALSGTVQDITELKQAEVSLRESEERLRTVFASSPDFLVLLDPEHRIRLINRGEEGIDPEATIGTPLYELVAPADRERVAGHLDRVIRQAEQQQYDIAYDRPDGTRVHFSSVAAPVVVDGRVKGAVVSARDVTQQRKLQADKAQLEEQFRQAQKMEAIGRLAGGVAHDFNNLLCVITGSAKLALCDLPLGDPLRETLEEIAAAAARAGELTRQLLAFSRKQVIEPKVMDLSSCIAKLLPMLTRLLGEDIRLSTVTPTGVGCVRLDPAQLDQVMLNLAVNARDAMPQGGELLIETAAATLDEAYCQKHVGAVPGAYVRLTVRDTGVGMDAETQAKIFEPFFTTKPLGQGTGLGLATVFGIVQQNGGFIEVRSGPGEGACFEICWPRVNTAGPISVAEPPVPPRGRETVLLVEDDEMVRKLAVRQLGRLGYRVLATGSGGEALVLAEKHEGVIDLLLTDVVMPYMNGRELAERLTASQPGLKVLFTSGYDHNVIAQHGVLDDGLRFIAKPFDISSLAAKVRGALDDEDER